LLPARLPLCTMRFSLLFVASASCSNIHLRLRGGGSAPAATATLAPPPTATEAEGPPPPLPLRAVEGGESGPSASHQVQLSPATLERLRLEPGSRVTLRKNKKPPFWSAAPAQFVGEASARADLDEGSVMLPRRSMQLTSVRRGDLLVVSVPATSAAPASAAQPADGADRSPRRHYGYGHSGWGRSFYWWWMLNSGPRYSYGYPGGGYGYGRSRGFGGGYGGRRSAGGRRSYRRR